MAEEGLTLIVRHLPGELTTQEQEELLHHFGATNVRTMGHKGRMKHIAFATFPDKDLAHAALTKLHQIEILGTKLVVEFSNNQHKKFHPTQCDRFPKVKSNVDDGIKKVDKAVVRKEEIDVEKVYENVNSFSRKWGIQYPMDPRLEYMYPAPSVSILTNIANALASIPKLYVQVLHLMNKMNLPAPFGPITATPVIPEGNASMRTSEVNGSSSGVLRNNIQTGNFNSMQPEGSTEESELESDGELGKREVQPKMPQKRPRKSGSKPRKKPKLVQVLPDATKPKTVVPKRSDVFDQSEVTQPKKIAFNLPRLEQGGSGGSPSVEPMEIDNQEDQVPADTMTPLSGAPPLPPSSGDLLNQPVLSEQDAGVELVLPLVATTNIDMPPDGVTTDIVAPSEADEVVLPPLPPPLPPQPVLVEGGFGKIEPISRESDTEESSDEEEDWGKSDFISSHEMRKGRISSSEMRELSVFRKYDRGEPSTRLYIKNIAKAVTDKDLHYVYGRYVDWENKEHCNMFDIRLMKEGRMKGQAFVTLPSVKLAKDARRDTNGYKLQNKPIVVQFARSAKAKPDEPKDARVK